MGRPIRFFAVCALWLALLWVGLQQATPLHGSVASGASAADWSQRRVTAQPTATPATGATEKQPTPTPAPSGAKAEASEPLPPPIELSIPISGANPSAARVFSAISPAVAFVETEAATGSGLLIPGRYLLSNAHVVWPFSAVRVVFPDGSEFLDVPVIGWDLTADLALLGPIDTPLQPIGLVDGGQIEIGTDVYLIGYPAEVDDFPQPTITNGILSRYRKWDSIGYTFFQVDATITNGQSGGVMVNHNGDVVGISTFYYSGFGLAGSVADALPRLNAILGHDTGVVINSRTFAGGETGRVFSDTLTSGTDRRRYVLQAPKGTEVEMEAVGVGHPQIIASALRSYQLESTRDSEPVGNRVNLDFEVEHDEPYVVEIFQESENQNQFFFTSTYTLTLFPDIDDNQPLSIGVSYVGAIDLPLDRDFFELELAEGDRLEIVVDALGIDPRLELSYETETRRLIVDDDDSGGGIFGESAKIVFEAPESGSYQLVVSQFSYSGDVGSYFLSVSAPDAKARMTKINTDEEMLPTGFGPMGLYESDKNYFHILYPLGWQSMPNSQCGPGVELCLAGEAAAYLVVEEELTQLPRRDRNREGYMNILLDLLTSQPGVKLESQQPYTTLQGLPADMLVFSIQGGVATGRRLVYVDEEELVAFGATLVTQGDAYAETEALANLLLESFRYWTDDEREESAVYHFDEAVRLSAGKQYSEALTSYGQALELDPQLAPAYERRGWLHYRFGRLDEALADLSQAIEIRPDDADLYGGRSQMRWTGGDYAAALEDIDAAIELKPDRANDYNTKALIYAAMEEFDAALAAIDAIREFSEEDELSPSVQDTLAYIYLKMGEVEKAKAEFDAIFAKDLRFAYALLGGGVAYGLAGDEAQAAALIAEAMELFEPEDLEFPTPQLADLLEMAEPFRSGTEE